MLVQRPTVPFVAVAGSAPHGAVRRRCPALVAAPRLLVLLLVLMPILLLDRMLVLLLLLMLVLMLVLMIVPLLVLMLVPLLVPMLVLAKPC